MQYILVTGASTGIGYATSKYLIQKGYFVFGSVRKTTDAQRCEQELGDQFKALIFDVRDVEAIQTAKLEVEQILGDQGLTGLVNNAGIVIFGPLQFLPVEEFEKQLAINVMGVVKVIQVFLPLLGATAPQVVSPGKIINISSISGLFTNPFLIPYCASKAALESISDGLRRELLIYGIDVISILPGPIKTPIWKKAVEVNTSYDGTPYATIFSKTQHFISKIENRGLKPEKIAERIHKILNKKRPKTRYIIHRSPLQIRLIQLLPARWIDALFRGQFKKAMMKKDNQE